ncbi:MAG: rhodanese-like domain-containing protein [Saprospiraceae bacterium]
MLNFFKKLFRPEKTSESLHSILAQGALLVDVRNPTELESGQVPGAMNIPLSQVASNLDAFKHQKHIIVYCRTGSRAAAAQTILQSNGIKNVSNGGSWKQVNEAMQSI